MFIFVPDFFFVEFTKFLLLNCVYLYCVSCLLQENEADKGIVMRTLDDLFSRSSDSSNGTMKIAISFVEIYNEKAFDLMSGSDEPINVKSKLFLH